MSLVSPLRFISVFRGFFLFFLISPTFSIFLCPYLCRRFYTVCGLRLLNSLRSTSSRSFFHVIAVCLARRDELFGGNVFACFCMFLCALPASVRLVSFAFLSVDFAFAFAFCLVLCFKICYILYPSHSLPLPPARWFCGFFFFFFLGREDRTGT